MNVGRVDASALAAHASSKLLPRVNAFPQGIDGGYNSSCRAWSWRNSDGNFSRPVCKSVTIQIQWCQTNQFVNLSIVVHERGNLQLLSRQMTLNHPAIDSHGPQPLSLGCLYVVLAHRQQEVASGYHRSHSTSPRGAKHRDRYCQRPWRQHHAPTGL